MRYAGDNNVRRKQQPALYQQCRLVMQQLLPPYTGDELREHDGRDRSFVAPGLLINEVKQWSRYRTVGRVEDAEWNVFAPDLPLPFDLFGLGRVYFYIDSDDMGIVRPADRTSIF